LYRPTCTTHNLDLESARSWVGSSYYGFEDFKKQNCMFFLILEKNMVWKKNSKITQFVYVAIRKYDIQTCRYSQSRYFYLKKYEMGCTWGEKG